MVRRLPYEGHGVLDRHLLARGSHLLRCWLRGPCAVDLRCDLLRLLVGGLRLHEGQATGRTTQVPVRRERSARRSSWFQRERILGLLFGYSVEGIERFETRHPFFGGESHVPIVDGSITMATRRQLSSHVAHMNNPFWSAVRRVPANLRAFVTRLQYFGSSPLRPTRGGRCTSVYHAWVRQIDSPPLGEPFPPWLAPGVHYVVVPSRRPPSKETVREATEGLRRLLIAVEAGELETLQPTRRRPTEASPGHACGLGDGAWGDDKGPRPRGVTPPCRSRKGRRTENGP